MRPGEKRSEPHAAHHTRSRHGQCRILRENRARVLVQHAAYESVASRVCGIVLEGSEPGMIWSMPLDGLPTVEQIRKRVVSELVDADVRFASRRRTSRKARIARGLWRRARSIIP